MKNKTLRKFLLILLGLMLLLPSWSFAASSNQLDTLTQPTFTEGSVHDPSVIKVGDDYYVFGSHLAAAKTKDFMHWEMVASGVDSNNPLFNDVIEDLEEAFDWATKISLWAPDVIQLDDGKFYMYYNAAEGSSPRSALGIAVADHIEGPYTDLGIILKSGMWEQESEDGTLYDANIHPNVIDPHTFFDVEGRLWMVYGSYSGGIFILEMDPETGFPLEGQGYGTKLTGGNHSRIEAPYIQYDPETEYYYLYLTFGGLDSVGGYNMRVARSKNPDGPYVDAEGNDMINVKGQDGTMFDDVSIAPYGVKLMGNYLFERQLGEPGTGIGTGYVSPGHNSVYYDEESGKQYLIFHTRFPQRGEAHEIRVHQIFMNEEGWPVIAPYRYTGEELTKVNEADVTGDYKFVNHGKDITADIKQSIPIKLNEDGTISGLEGTWELKNDYYIELHVDGDVYKGVLVEQWDPTSTSYVLTFTALSNQGVSVWGSKNDLSYVSDEELVNAVIDDINLGDTSAIITDLTLPTDGARQTEINWESSDPSVISETGKVTRPAGQDPVTVTLTATAIQGSEQASKHFIVTVYPLQGAELIAHYAFEDNLTEANSRVGEGSVTGDRINGEGGNITYTDGILGQAAVFDGESGIRLPDGLISNYSYSVSVWLQPDQLTDFTTTFFGARDLNGWVSLAPKGPADGNTMIWSGDSPYYDAPSGMTIPTEEWAHLAFTVEYGEINLYINGEKKFSGTGFPNVFTTSDSVFSLGVNYWDVPYKGLMDELKVFQGVLSEEEIESEYNTYAPAQPEPPQKTGLVAHYAFENDLSEADGRLGAGTETGNRIDNAGGTITFTESKEGLGQAAVFDGASGVRLPNDLITSNQYSVSLWLNPDELNVHTTSFFGAMTTDSWISLLPGGNSASPEQLMVWSGSDLGTGWYDATTGMTIPLGEWSHVAFTVDEGKLDIYINGEHQATHEGFPDIFTGLNSVFGLGVNYWDPPYKGLMDELLVYNNYVLTEEQIKNYYEHGEIPGEEDPVIDTSELEALIAEAKSFINDERQYTKDSLAALNEALKEAEEALPSIDSEDELTSIIETLQTAIADLQVAKDPEPGEEDEEGDEKPEEPGKSRTIIDELGQAIDVYEIDEVIVQVDGMNTRLIMPDNIPEGTKISIEDARERSEATKAENLMIAGDVLDVSILGLDYDQVQGSFVLTMAYDKDKYEADEVAIYYYDEDQALWVKQNGTVDAEAGTITVEVDHFSMYGVFAESTAPIVDDEHADADEENGVEIDDDEKEVDDPTIEETEEEKEGEQIPKTATTMYNYIFIGIILVVAGVAFLYITRRGKKVS